MSPNLDSVVLPDVRLREMRTGIGFIVSPSDRLRLAAIISARSSLQKHVWRAHIVLLSTDGIGTSAIMSATGKPATCVWRWQERFMVTGVVGPVAREDAPARHPEDRRGQDGGSDPSEAGFTAAGRDALDGAGDAKNGGACGLDRAGYLEGTWPCATYPSFGEKKI